MGSKILSFSKHKFASNVVEKCLMQGDDAGKQELFKVVLGTTENSHPPLEEMIKDQYANYVVQKMVEVASEEQRKEIHSRIVSLRLDLASMSFGKHIHSKMEESKGTSEEQLKKVLSQILSP